ncbi:MAG TPA: bifunctional diaminohydroxyphosphoribosylaminopyrimidine deaminase/5-amino-6-(5-phosphoribosylamino)uracil reductase RibD [Steroidobacteraceae bacterium]|jgi:diaminohydroxyphosphoribosylaminopyrimidine deaminase/5-amino-6-(5-phosphoribosylamino)uracil reductase|nr:bifunctional diaminohydroxyphosphoribosylaminopyrimidine deaminase/5-amino-6-(5-phosphoribosylamino)uracil reductase RibD [Steroidobacteraceae bacterium]
MSAALLPAEDEARMGRALSLAARGLYTTDPNPRVGCILVRDGQVIGEGWHERAGEAHAEAAALRVAGDAARGATAYVTLEPCSHHGRTPPCADALIAAGIARVVCASIDPNPQVAGAGVRRLEAAGIAVSVGARAAEARALNVGFFSRFERGRPWIRLKLAMSLDARTAPAGGGRVWISGEESRADVQRWRARSSAILTGAGTVRVDDPRLDVRLEYGPWIRQPLRIVLDAHRNCPPDAQVFRGGAALRFTADGAPQAESPRVESSRACGAGQLPLEERVPAVGRRLDLAAVVKRLASLEINELLVECGPTLAAAFLEACLVDELILYVAPLLLGADAAPLTALQGLRGGDPAAAAFEITDVQRLGADVRLILRPRRDTGHPVPALQRR